MNSKWTLIALLFSVTVNIAVVGTLIYFWQHNNEQRHVNVKVLRTDDNSQQDVVWFGQPPAPPPVAKEIDSLRREYHEDLVVMRQAIDADRQQIIMQLMHDPVNRDTVEVILNNLTKKQMDAERLTIDHLLDIKPLLPTDDWKFFIQDLRPRHTIRTKVIKLREGDSTSILVDDKEIQEFKIFKHEKNEEKRIELKHKKK